MDILDDMGVSKLSAKVFLFLFFIFFSSSLLSSILVSQQCNTMCLGTLSSQHDNYNNIQTKLKPQPSSLFNYHSVPYYPRDKLSLKHDVCVGMLC